jgi:hypothetical protein
VNPFPYIAKGFGIAVKNARYAVGAFLKDDWYRVPRRGGEAVYNKGSIGSEWQRFGTDAAHVFFSATGLAGLGYLGVKALQTVGFLEKTPQTIDTYAKVSIAITAGLAALYIVTRKR